METESEEAELTEKTEQCRGQRRDSLVEEHMDEDVLAMSVSVSDCSSLSDEPTKPRRSKKRKLSLMGGSSTDDDKFLLTLKDNEVKTKVILTLVTPDNLNPDMELLRSLLEGGYHPDCKNEKEQTPLMIVCKFLGRLDIVELLLDHNADVNLHSTNNVTPLGYASYEGYTDIVELLLKKGADVNALNQVGRTALSNASSPGHVDTVRVLLQHGADATTDLKDQRGATPLHYAAQGGHLEVAELLLDNGASIEETNRPGGTALSIAIAAGHIDVANLLLSRGANVNTETGDNNQTPLMFAIMIGDMEMVKLVLKYHPDINTRSKNGITALMLAVQGCHDDIVNTLLEQGADPNLAEKGTGWSPLHVAVKHAHFNVARMLFEHKAQPDINDLLLAFDVIQVLLSDSNSRVMSELFENFGFKRDKDHKISEVSINEIHNQDETLHKVFTQHATELHIQNEPKNRFLFPVGVPQQTTSIGIDFQEEFKDSTLVPTRTKDYTHSGIFGYIEKLIVNGEKCVGRKYRNDLLDYQDKKRLRDAIRQLEKLSHENIAKMKGVCFYDELTYPVIITEILDTTLDRKNLEKTSLEMRLSILNKVAKGLAYLHDKDVTYYSLTAQNVRVTESLDVVKIGGIDDGLIVDRKKLLAHNQDNSSIAVYMPPEVSNTVLIYTQFDVFSFGHLAMCTVIGEFSMAILFPAEHVTAQEHHVEGMTEVERRQGYVSRLDDILGSGVYRSVGDLIKQCLHDEPQKRPKAQKILLLLKPGGTALNTAIAAGHIDVANVLLIRGANINAETRENNQTPLMFATMIGDMEMVRLVLKYRPDINARSKNGITALMLAVQGCHDDIVNTLLDQGADPNLAEKETGWSPLHVAVKHAHSNIAKMLLEISDDIVNNVSAFDVMQVLLSDSNSRAMSEVFEEFGFERNKDHKISEVSINEIHNQDETLHKIFTQHATELHIQDEQKNQFLFPEQITKAITVNAQLFGEAMKEGSVTLQILKMLLTGVAGSGKTSTLDLLLDKEPETNRKSTPCACRPVCVIPIELVSGFESTFWSKLKLKEFVAHMAKNFTVASIPSDASVPSDEGVPLDANVPSVPIIPLDTNILSDINVPSYASVPSNTSVPSDTASPITEDFVDTTNNLQSSPSQDESATVEELVQLMEQSSGLGIHLERKWISVTDCGGQPQFQVVLPLFLWQTALFVHVQNLSESLSEKPFINYYVKGKPLSKPIQSPLSNEEHLKCAVQSVQSFRYIAESQEKTSSEVHNASKGKSPTILFIATHEDEYEKKMSSATLEEEKIGETHEEKEKKMTAMLEPYTREGKLDVTYCGHHMQKLLFCINANSREAKEINMATKIRTRINNFFPDGRDIPLRWFVLQLKLHELAEEKERQIITKKECLDAARSIHLRSEEALDAALRYLDHLNIIFYYPEILPDVIFCHIQVLMDILTKIVEHLYRLMGDDPEGDTPTGGEWKKFRDFGRITKAMLEEFGQHYIQRDIFTVDDLLTLFQALHIIAVFQKDSCEDLEYFMPCLLHIMEPDKVKDHIASFQSNMHRLVLHFPNGLFTGVFCFTIAILLHKTPASTHAEWKFRFVRRSGSTTPKCLYRNIVQFNAPGYPGTVTLVDRFFFIEIIVASESPFYEELCPLVKKTVLDSLAKATKHLHYVDNQPEEGVLCQCGEGEQHPAIIKCTKKGKLWLECTYTQSSTTVPGNLQEINDIWNDEEISSEPMELSVSDVPILETEWSDVLKYFHKVGLKHARILGVELGLDIVTVGDMNIDDIVREWKKKAGYVLKKNENPHTWNVLYKALLAIRQDGIADEVYREFFLQS